MEAVEKIAAALGVGVPRQTANTRLAGLRISAIPSFRNYLFFNLTPSGEIEIIRVLHGALAIKRILIDE